MTCTRRSLILLTAAGVLSSRINRLVAQERVSSLNGPAAPHRADTTKFRSQRYVVNATVILGSVFCRSRVGGALLTVEEAGNAAYGSVGLQFGAGSWPQRLNGFNRFGMTQEALRLEHGQLTESTYLSFMVSCQETDLTQAERAFQSNQDSLVLTIARASPQQRVPLPACGTR